MFTDQIQNRMPEHYDDHFNINECFEITDPQNPQLLPQGYSFDFRAVEYGTTSSSNNGIIQTSHPV